MHTVDPMSCEFGTSLCMGVNYKLQQLEKVFDKVLGCSATWFFVASSNDPSSECWHLCNATWTCNKDADPHTTLCHKSLIMWQSLPAYNGGFTNSVGGSQWRSLQWD